MTCGRSGTRCAAHVLCAVGGWLLFTWSIEAAAIAYTFTKIADTTGGEFSSFGFPSINNAGTVAFSVSLSSGGQGIFVGNGSSLTPIVDTSGAFGGFGDGVINGSGAVAFRAFLKAGGQGVFVGSENALTTIADTSSTFSFFTGTPSINNAGTVAFNGFLNAAPGSGIFAGNGSTLTTIVDASGQFSNFGSPFITQAGAVIFPAITSSGDGIFLGNGSATPTVLIDQDSGLKFFQSPSANSQGAVAFIASSQPTGQTTGVFILNGQSLTELADDSGEFLQLGHPAINVAGEVAFSSELTGSFPNVIIGSGIFTGPDPTDDKVIATGDALNGSTVASVVDVGFVSSGLNDAGQIAFFAPLDNGSFGIFRADPVRSAPAPAPLALMLWGVVALWLIRHRTGPRRVERKRT